MPGSPSVYGRRVSEGSNVEKHPDPSDNRSPEGFAVSLLEEGVAETEGQGLSVEHSRSSRFGQGKTHDTQEK